MEMTSAIRLAAMASLAACLCDAGQNVPAPIPTVPPALKAEITQFQGYSFPTQAESAQFDQKVPIIGPRSCIDMLKAADAMPRLNGPLGSDGNHAPATLEKTLFATSLACENQLVAARSPYANIPISFQFSLCMDLPHLQVGPDGSGYNSACAWITALMFRFIEKQAPH
jgi:hypothetical protein